jgi:uncharacterized protein YuzE
MKITYDPYADAMYIYTNGVKRVDKTKEVENDLLVDLGKKNELLGIEMLSVSKKIPKKELKSVNFEFNLQQPTPLLK